MRAGTPVKGGGDDGGTVDVVSQILAVEARLSEQIRALETAAKHYRPMAS